MKIRFCFFVKFKNDVYTKVWLRHEWNKIVWLINAITFFSACVIQELSIIQILMPISFYHNGSWDGAQYFVYSGDYCQTDIGKIVFKLSKFTWREWVYLASFFCV